MRFKLVETIEQGDLIKNKVDELVVIDLGVGKTYDVFGKLDETKKRKYITKALETLENINNLKPSITEYINNLVREGISKYENPFVIYIENIKEKVPTTVVKVLEEKIKDGEIDPVKDEWIYDKKLYKDQYTSERDIRDTIYKINAINYANKNKLEIEGKRYLGKDLIDMSADKIRERISKSDKKVEDFDYEFIEAFIRYIETLEDSEDFYKKLSQMQKDKTLENANKEEITKIINVLEKIVEKIYSNEPKKIKELNNILQTIIEDNNKWRAFLKQGVDSIDKNDFKDNLSDVLNKIKNLENGKTLITLLNELRGEIPFPKYITDEVFKNRDEYNNADKETMKLYGNELNQLLKNYTQEQQLGNDKNSALGKLFLKRNIKKEDVNDTIFKFFQDRVNERIKSQKKPKIKTNNTFNYNGDDVS